MRFFLLAIYKKRTTPFQPYHEAEFGLQVIEHCHEATGTTAACRLSEAIEKEEFVEVRRKRFRSARTKHFKAPFCKKNLVSHYKGVHSEI